MPLFRYRALTEMGKRVSGVIDADSFDLAKERLKKEKVFVTKLSAVQHKKEIALRPQLLLAFTRELGQLLQAGLPLYESLLTVEEKYRHHRSHALLLDLCDKLKGGAQLSEALSMYPKTFDSIFISMVRAGEKTGSLGWAFQQIYELIERRQKLGKQLISAMAYPAFLGVFCFLMVIGLLLFVIPSMRELFEGRHLHPLTQTVLSISNFLEHSFVTILLTVLCVVSAVTYFFRQPQGKLWFQKVMQKIPILKTVLLQAALIRFCRSASILLKGGVPLTTSLAISRGSMRHALLEEAIAAAENSLIEGKTLSGQLKNSPYIPPLVTRMLSIAEETGKLPEMLKSLSDIYDGELERSLTLVTTFLQPALLVVLGGVVGLVILSILLPLTDVSSLISS